ncbi:hypothetical protein D3C86_1606340 [compost metagenome]
MNSPVADISRLTSARRMPALIRTRLWPQNALKRLLNRTIRCSASNSTKASEILSMASIKCRCAVSALRRASLSK